MRVTNTEEFIVKAKMIHGESYDYSRVDYRGKLEKVEMVCPIHGSFLQTPEAHYVRGCPKCSFEIKCRNGTKTTEEFVRQSRVVHGRKYGYEKTVYTGKRNKVCIVCHIHGEFWQHPCNHLNGSGCPSCSGVGRYTKEGFVKRATDLYGDKFDYTDVKIDGCFNRVRISCPSHGFMDVRPTVFLQGKTVCRDCEIEKRGRAFIDRAKKLHGNRYDYGLVKYKRMKQEVRIVCGKHGVFCKSPFAHVSGKAGCPVCYPGIKSGRKKRDNNEFIRDAVSVHGQRYDFSRVKYVGIIKKVTIVCLKHGSFSQIANNHLMGQGCPRCRESKGEEMTAKVLDQLGEKFERQKIFLKCRDKKCLPFDFYLTRRRILMEVDGVQHYQPSSFTNNKSRVFRERCFASVKKHDKMRNDFAKNSGLVMIRIPYWVVRDKAKLRDWLVRRLRNKGVVKQR